MDHSLLGLALLLVAVAVAALLRRRFELRDQERNLAERATAVGHGTHRARLQYPSVDLSNCIGCGACVRACPEDGVLALAHGQAVVVHGARCVGHGLCAQVCPTSAIALTLADLETRRDLPAIDAEHQAVGVQGLYLAGEITGFALVRTAVSHGALVARSVAARRAAAAKDHQDHPADAVVDLLVIGTGPAGLSCMLAATELGLSVVGVDQAAEVGGTVAAYPRKKMVMTQPMDLPLHGRLKRLEYTKEQLVELWQDLAVRHQLDVRTETRVDQVRQHEDGSFAVVTDRGTLRAHHVCLAVGRRGSPRKLGAKGEQLAKVAYALLDAESYQDQRVLVVGGGDSAIEAALALAEQPGNEVTLSYRQAVFSRLKAKNQQRIEAAIADGAVIARFGTSVAEITADEVVLEPLERPVDGDGGVATATSRLPNDLVFIFAGGTPPFPLLETAGVSFDPTMRAIADVATDRGTSLLAALGATLFGLITLLVVRTTWNDYYDLAPALRAGSELHSLLRPQGVIGLLAGTAAAVLFAMNLLYLLRRTIGIGRYLPFTLKAWMSMHVATGLGACLLAVLHSGYVVRDSAGGHALLAMIVVVLAGVVGRWFYAFVPRAQNGRQQSLEELKVQVAAIAGEWDSGGRGLATQVRQRIEAMVEHAHIGRSFVGRVIGLVRSQWLLRSQLDDIRRIAVAEDLPASQITRVVRLARRSHRLAMQLAHFDDLRGLLSTWRWLHRWLALLLLLLTAVHVYYSLRYGGIDFGVFGGSSVGGGK